MAWLVLVAAGLLEILWAYALKQSHGFTRLAPSALSVAAMTGSLALLAIALRTLPLGTAYTIWTGIGALGAFTLGVTVMGEQLTPLRVLAAGLIIAGVVMMNLASATR
jgi:quaternary ammonium compound-resistance protein SugE